MQTLKWRWQGWFGASVGVIVPATAASHARRRRRGGGGKGKRRSKVHAQEDKQNNKKYSIRRNTSQSDQTEKSFLLIRKLGDKI